MGMGRKMMLVSKYVVENTTIDIKMPAEAMP
jgi:hypothetical protein